MKKKFFSVSLSFILLGSLIGCGSNSVSVDSNLPTETEDFCGIDFVDDETGDFTIEENTEGEPRVATPAPQDIDLSTDFGWCWYDLSSINWSTSSVKKTSEELGVTDDESFFLYHLSWTYDENLSREAAQESDIWICDNYSVSFLHLTDKLTAVAESYPETTHSDNVSLLAVDFSIFGNPDLITYYNCQTGSTEAQMVTYVWKYNSYYIVFPWISTATDYADSMGGVYIVSPAGYEHYFGENGIYTKLNINMYEGTVFHSLTFDEAYALSNQ